MFYNSILFRTLTEAGESMDSQRLLEEATRARERMDYPSAITYYTQVINSSDATRWERCQAFHMRAVCLRCQAKSDELAGSSDEATNNYLLAGENLAEARQWTDDETVLARIDRDEAMIYLDRGEEGDPANAAAMLEHSIICLQQAFNAPTLTDNQERRKLQAEMACSIGFRGRLRMIQGDYGTAITDLRDAQRTLLCTRQLHYAVNNQVWLVRALSQYKQRPIMQYAHMRGHALLGLLLCPVPHEGGYAGSMKRAGEFITLLIGGEKLYQRVRTRLARKQG